jgi:hypothetical protein
MKSIKNYWQKTKILIFGTVLVMGMTNSLTAVQNGPDILAKLGLDPASAKDSFLDSLASGDVYNDTAMKVFKTLPALARAEIVRAGLGWIKAYVATAEFKANYQEFRENKKPAAAAVRPAYEEVLKKQKDDFEKQIVETRKNMAGLDAATKESMEKGIREMRAQMEAMEKNPQQKELMRQMTDVARVEDKKHYEEQLKAWEEKFPTEPRALVKKRINDFLAASAGVDFAAKLLPRGEKMVFANEEYEQKPSEWKVCFRAGREATEAARAFAKAWLPELEGK